MTAVFVSLVAVLTSVYVSNMQLRESQRQFQATLAEGRYSSIIDALTSDSVPVRAGAIGRLYEYATNTTVSDGRPRVSAAIDAVELLALLVQEESGKRPRDGLAPYYELPSPLIARAMRRLSSLLVWSRPATVLVDVNRSDFHGLRLSEVTGFWNAAGSDFRGASLTDWDLEGGYFSAAFFTCADLRLSDLGHASVNAADFTGADLRGADLADVTGLTSDQLVGAEVGPSTRLPAGVTAPRVRGGPMPLGGCSTLLRSMTGLPLGYGYTSSTQCPEEAGPATGRLCRLRAQGE